MSSRLTGRRKNPRTVRKIPHEVRGDNGVVSQVERRRSRLHDREEGCYGSRVRPGLQAGLFLTFLACYTLSGSKEELWGDPKASYRVAEHFVTDGDIDIGYGLPIH